MDLSNLSTRLIAAATAIATSTLIFTALTGLFDPAHNPLFAQRLQERAPALAQASSRLAATQVAQTTVGTQAR